MISNIGVYVESRERRISKLDAFCLVIKVVSEISTCVNGDILSSPLSSFALIVIFDYYARNRVCRKRSSKFDLERFSIFSFSFLPPL